MSKSNVCLTCAKAVYPMDKQVNLDGRFYHQQCAKCADCGGNITVKNFTSIEEQGKLILLCKTHYMKRFQESGGIYAGGDKFAKQTTRVLPGAGTGAGTGGDEATPSATSAPSPAPARLSHFVPPAAPSDSSSSPSKGKVNKPSWVKDGIDDAPATAPTPTPATPTTASASASASATPEPTAAADAASETPDEAAKIAKEQMLFSDARKKEEEKAVAMKAKLAELAEEEERMHEQQELIKTEAAATEEDETVLQPLQEKDEGAEDTSSHSSFLQAKALHDERKKHDAELVKQKMKEDMHAKQLLKAATVASTAAAAAATTSTSGSEGSPLSPYLASKGTSTSTIQSTGVATVTSTAVSHGVGTNLIGSINGASDLDGLSMGEIRGMFTDLMAEVCKMNERMASMEATIAQLTPKA
jgi:hypothetical protein